MNSTYNEPIRLDDWIDRVGIGGTAAQELMEWLGIVPVAVQLPGSADVAHVLTPDQRESLDRALVEAVSQQPPTEAQPVAPLDGLTVARFLMESSRDGLPLRHELLAGLLGVDPANSEAIHTEALAYGFRLRRLGQRAGRASDPDRPTDRRPWLAVMLRP
ncbi:hypothetical protein VB738_12600 [Cyanobium gracile UHCC 0139]|uniref:Uncharacterized protein n=1 Tax=Cyanobium gracile UHCC 0139 TaxID=3110308 RepID=A0ABU5RWK6_9CYAN|nr:hypothetical protein [Cyanobium gracile]MEA5392098.1 hypothetical protein [Cyanobium gracile UHCC 0139]